MQPMNYNIDVKPAFESAIQGAQVGQALRQQAQQQALQQQMQLDLLKLSSNPNANAQDYAAAMTRYPQISEHLKRSWDVKNADQQQNDLSQASQVYATLQAGKPEVAVDLLNKRVEALKNSGMEKEANAALAMKHIIEMNPAAAKTSVGLMLASILGPEKFGSTFTQVSEQNRANEKQPAELRKLKAEADIKEVEAKNLPEKVALENQNIASQIDERSKRLSLDRDKLTSEVQLKIAEMNPAFKLDDGAKKIINESAVASVAAGQSANQMLDLAGRLEKEQAGYGSFSTASEWMKAATGNQDALTQMRNEYTRIRSQGVLKNLPPGPASDKDIQMAQKGFPPESADSKTMAQFLRGMAKIQQYDAVQQNAKAEWVNAVGHLGKPKTDIEIDGVKVPAGSTFTDFANQFFKRKTEAKAAQASINNVQGRSYMKYATPGAQ